MAQLIVRNLSDDAKEGLKRRAQRHGRSLEAEVREILEQASLQPAKGERTGETGDSAPVGLGTQISMIVKEHGITNEDIDELERNIAEGRRQWRDRDVDLK